jgi:isoleucyl-tRNA synthetase
LRREGRVREIVHTVQNARKHAGLRVEDRIELALDGAQALLDAARVHRDYLTGETLTVKLALGTNATSERAGAGHSEHTKVEGLDLTLALWRVPAAGSP